jgi:hypothetical protein
MATDVTAARATGNFGFSGSRAATISQATP